VYLYRAAVARLFEREKLFAGGRLRKTGSITTKRKQFTTRTQAIYAVLKAKIKYKNASYHQ